MARYDLILRVAGEEDFTGDEIPVGRVSGNRITGRMSGQIREIVDRGSVQIGITGPVVDYTLDDADLVAYAVSMSIYSFIEAGIDERGTVVAVDESGDEIPFRYEGEASGGDYINTTIPVTGDLAPVD